MPCLPDARFAKINPQPIKSIKSKTFLNRRSSFQGGSVQDSGKRPNKPEFKMESKSQTET
jgi:hypothetical protein